MALRRRSSVRVSAADVIAACVMASVVIAALLCSAPVRAGTFVFAGESNGADLITHPPGYVGTGGEVTVGVCINPAGPHASEMVQSVLNVIDTLNALDPQLGNIVGSASSDVPANHIDFESVALHEMGHCVGLGHVNLASESGLSGANREYTATTRGEDLEFDLVAGADGVIGSADDGRGDDVNLHWFKRADNDPFSIEAVVDQTTYARSAGLLPGADTSAANASRALAAAWSLPASEAVMQQGTHVEEAQRGLGHDDVATLRYAQSGLDETAGTQDDYTLRLEYVAYGEGCDVEIEFDDEETDFAVCKLTGAFVQGPSPNHTRITSGTIYFNDSYLWYFNPEYSAGSVPPVPLAGPFARIGLVLVLVAVAGARAGRGQG